jgi:hypothetical protein
LLGFIGFIEFFGFIGFNEEIIVVPKQEQRKAALDGSRSRGLRYFAPQGLVVLL